MARHPMTAAEILAETGFDQPEVRERLHPVVPETVPVKTMSFWVDFVLPAWIGAVTTPTTIWVRARIVAIGGTALGRLVLHELVHIRQWRQHGLLGFLRHYVRDYLTARVRKRHGHRVAYRSIPFEEEAYTVAADIKPFSQL